MNGRRAGKIPLVVEPGPVRIKQMGITCRTINGDRASTHVVFLGDKIKRQVGGGWVASRAKGMNARGEFYIGGLS